jgi:putative addiction module component (TIGR02574 family)
MSDSEGGMKLSKLFISCTGALLDLPIHALERLNMSPRLQQIEEQALRLSPEDRESLAGILVQSLEDAPASAVDAAWIAEAEQRYQKWRAGETDGISSEKFFSEIRRDLRCR